MTPQQRDRCRAVLDFWHTVEFFIPFDLEGQVLDSKDSDWAIRRFSPTALHKIPSDSCGDLWQVARVPEGEQLSSFELYLGVFDKSLLGEITDASASKVAAAALTNFEVVEQSERGELEGKTCFAKIRLTACGEPILDAISVSTAPWALGRVLDDGLASLNFELFEASVRSLQDDLQDFKAMRAPPVPEITPPSTAEGSSERPVVQPLTRGELETLLRMLYTWAGFTPEANDQVQVIVRARVRKKLKSELADRAGSSSPNAPAAKAYLIRAVPKARAGEEEDEDDSESETAIDILNSFYAKDIKRVLRALEEGNIGAALLDYLAPLPDVARTDLYTPAGRARILADLQPQLTPPAHWMGEPSHAMSLMQQFAINNTFRRLREPGMFSVNGPPGTGKTTLLRDIFAENITRRALVLAGFSNAADALCLSAALKVEFDGDPKACYVAPLRPEVCGFEMVVASTINAAVENISCDLPKAKALGTVKQDAVSGAALDGAWRNSDGSAKQTYLREVAHRIAAQDRNGGFQELGDEDTPWGLISAALGNRANRRAFSNGINFPPKCRGELPPRGYDPSKHKSIWEWRSQYRGLSFAQAKTELLAAQKALNDRKSALASLAAIRAEIASEFRRNYNATTDFVVIDSCITSGDKTVRYAMLVDMNDFSTIIRNNSQHDG